MPATRSGGTTTAAGREIRRDVRGQSALASRWKVAGRGLVQTRTACSPSRSTSSGRWRPSSATCAGRSGQLSQLGLGVVADLAALPRAPCRRAGARDRHRTRLGERNIESTGSGWAGAGSACTSATSPPVYEATVRRRLGQDQWHTYAVEVTTAADLVVRGRGRGPHRATSKALSGAEFQVRFTMKAVKGKRMNRARMQMDWLRYWTLEAPNTRSTRAPRPVRTTYQQAC